MIGMVLTFVLALVFLAVLYRPQLLYVPYGAARAMLEHFLFPLFQRPVRTGCAHSWDKGKCLLCGEPLLRLLENNAEPDEAA